MRSPSRCSAPPPLPQPDPLQPIHPRRDRAEKLLFDFGRGAPIRLTRIGVSLGSLTAHFVTHMHSDHVGGLPDVWTTGWLATPYGGRKVPMALYGPASPSPTCSTRSLPGKQHLEWPGRHG